MCCQASFGFNRNMPLNVLWGVFLCIQLPHGTDYLNLDCEHLKKSLYIQFYLRESGVNFMHICPPPSCFIFRHIQIYELSSATSFYYGAVSSSGAAAGVRCLGHWNHNIKSLGKLTHCSTRFTSCLRDLNQQPPDIKPACLTQSYQAMGHW